MFADTFFHFLSEDSLLTPRQAKEALLKKPLRVRPAIVAFYEKLMTEEQVKAVSELQLANDMPFGFLAVREGYLTHEQSAMISGRQPREDMLAIQVLSDKGFMSMTAVFENLGRFKEHYSLNDDAYEELVANRVEGFVEYISGVKCGGLFPKFVAVFIKTFIKCVSGSIRIEKVHEEDFLDGEHIITARCVGDQNVTLGLVMDSTDSALNIAGRFVRQRQREYNEDVEDSIKELLNIAAGLFVTVIEKDMQTDMELLPPEIMEVGRFQTGAPINVIDIYSIDISARLFFTEK